MTVDTHIAWHNIHSVDALHRLKTHEQGLTQQEAEARLKIHGLNTFATGQKKSWLIRFIKQFHDPLIYVLLAAGLITLLLKHWTDSGVIAAVVLLNALIGFIQEQKAENELAAIRRLLSLNANVLRDGAQKTIPAENIVPGDIVMIAAGDKVPADLRLISAHGLRAQEAILTGESLDVEKNHHTAAADAALSDRTCIAYGGTLITAGQGKGVAVATGRNSEIGRISSMLAGTETPETPLVRRLTGFSRRLAAVVVTIAILVFLFGITIRGVAMNEMFMVMIAIAVSSIPEGLPAVISITLALGVRAMARRKAIVRHLPVIETLGSVTVICTDKTGTLTRNELMVTDMVTAAHTFSISGTGYDPDGKIYLDTEEITDLARFPPADSIAHAAALNNDSTLNRNNGTWELSGDPTEGALMAFARKAGHLAEDLQIEWPRADVIPFSAESRYMATLHHGSHSSIVYVKGAPEELLKMCHMQQGSTGLEPVNRDFWIDRVSMLARQGKRVLAVASLETDRSHTKLEHGNISSNLTMLGLLGIMDTAREEAMPAIAACRSAGIKVKMITGDHALTAACIGNMLGIPDSGKVLTGQDIDTYEAGQLAQAVEEVNIYARMHPEHKMKLVKALQSKGEVVAMTGDGVNDAPALKTADIGISMGVQGTEAAREASAMILADDNFATIVHAVEEGRNVYRNIRRTIQFMLVTDGCEGLVLVLATLIGWTLPITPLQILWVNMVTAVTLSLSFAFAPYDPSVMRRPPLPLHSPMFSRRQITLCIAQTFIITVGVIGLFLYEMTPGDINKARTFAVNTLVAFQIYYLWSMLLTENNLTYSLKAYITPLLSTVAIIILQGLFTYAPWMQSIFLTAPLNAHDWLIISATSSSIALWMLVEQRLSPSMK